MRLTVEYTWDGTPLPVPAALVTLVPGDDADLVLQVSAPLHGDPPPPGQPGFFDTLYEHEVVELFLVGDGDPVPYLEIELGPHGHFLVLHLDGVRKVVGVERALEVVVGHDDGHWHAQAKIPLAWLPPGPWQANAFAIHGVGDERRYCAAHPLPGPLPDFHQPARFPVVHLPGV